MYTSRCLFIGGFHDGQWIELNRPCPQYVQLPNYPRELSMRVEDQPGDQIMDIQTEGFNRQTLRVDDSEFAFYVHTGLSPRQAIARLILGYTKPQVEKMK